MIMDKYSDITEVLGHCDVQDNKPNCPGFNVKEWLEQPEPTPPAEPEQEAPTADADSDGSEEKEK